MTRRYLALHLPRLATDRLARAEPALRAAPLALWAERAGRRFLAALNAPAARHLAPGMALADALAMCPALVTRPAAPAADAALLARLARWATRYTPLAAPDGADALVLDILGCAHAFGGEANLLDDAAHRLAAMGFALRAAIAGSAAAALALARAGRHGAIVAAGEEAAALAPLPLVALGLAEEARARLEAFGLCTAGALLRLPRAGLARRVGPDALAMLDRALGRAPAPIRPLAPVAEFAAARDLAEPIITAEAVAAVLALLLDELCGQLARAGRGARRLSLACHRLDAEVQRIGIGTSLAVREPAHLARLFAARLDAIAPRDEDAAGIERMVLAAEVTEALDARQSAFDAVLAGRAERRAALGALVDRLRGRLGPRAVHGLALRPSHVPERAVAARDPLAELPEVLPPPARPRPVRLFDPPEPVSVVALLPDGPPGKFRWRGRVLNVRRAEGPERIGCEWWRDPDGASRDYWRIEAEEGARFWLYREPPAAWFLHGVFA